MVTVQRAASVLAPVAPVSGSAFRGMIRADRGSTREAKVLDYFRPSHDFHQGVGFTLNHQSSTRTPSPQKRRPRYRKSKPVSSSLLSCYHGSHLGKRGPRG